MDGSWWKVYCSEIRATFRGALFSTSKLTGFKRVTHLPKPFESFGNSGAGAIALAASGGASRIVLLGYDCGYAEDGRKHWFGDHPKGLGNAGSLAKWPKQFNNVRAKLADVEIINCSRETALTMFNRAALEDVL